MKEKTRMSKLTKIAQWLFAIDFLYVFYIWLYAFIANEMEGMVVFFYVSCGVFTFCGIIIFLVGAFLRTRTDENKKNIYQTLNCATWWSCTGIAYWLGLVLSFITAIAGIFFLLFSCFLWLELIRLLRLSRRAANKANV